MLIRHLNKDHANASNIQKWTFLQNINVARNIGGWQLANNAQIHVFRENSPNCENNVVDSVLYYYYFQIDTCYRWQFSKHSI